jgi:hypothetical protein
MWCSAALSLIACAPIARAEEPARTPEGAPAANGAVAPAAAPAGALEGIWMFDAKRSDDPRKIMEAARPSGGGGRGGGMPRGGGGMGGGPPGGGMGGGPPGGGMRGGPPGGAGGAGPPGDEEPADGAARGPSPFARVMRPANKVVIEMLADEIRVSEDEHAARPYAIQDSLEAHGHDLVTDGTTARWKGRRLEMSQVSGRGGRLVESYELSADGATLTIRARRVGGPEGMPNPTFTRVYSRYNGD